MAVVRGQIRTVIGTLDGRKESAEQNQGAKSDLSEEGTFLNSAHEASLPAFRAENSGMMGRIACQ